MASNSEDALRIAARNVQSPMFVIDGLDVSLHDSLAEVISSLEGIDVADGIYRVFDSEGRRIHLRAEGVRRECFMVDIGTVRSRFAGYKRTARRCPAWQRRGDVARQRALAGIMWERRGHGSQVRGSCNLAGDSGT